MVRAVRIGSQPPLTIEEKKKLPSIDVIFTVGLQVNP